MIDKQLRVHAAIVTNVGKTYAFLLARARLFLHKFAE